jgi:cobalt-zinc-cadmium efflux system outer membrane protein
MTALLLFFVGLEASAADAVAPVFPTDPPLPGEPVDGWPGLGDPPDAPLLDVETAVAEVLTRHPELVALERDAAAARAAWSAAGLVPGPTFEVEWSPDGAHAGVEGSALLDVRDLALAPARRSAAAAAAVAEVARTSGEAVRLAYDVRVAFLTLQAAAERRAISERSLDAQAAARDLARGLDAAGNVRALDVATHEAAYESLRQQVAAARLDEARARRGVEALLGRTDGWAPAPLAVLPAESGLPADAEERAEQASLELARMDAEITSLERAAAVALAEGVVPDLSVGAFGAWHDGTQEGAGLLLEGRVPLFGVGAAASAALRARADAARARRAQAALDVRAAARAALDTAEMAHARAAHYDRVLVPLQARVLAETLLQYNAMQVGAWQLLQAVRSQQDVASAAVDARRVWWEALGALDALLAGVRVDAPATAGVPAVPDRSVGGH